MTVGRVLAVIVLAALILFPGVELIRFFFSDLLGLYKEMTLTDCLLFFVILLLCALLLQRRVDEPRLRAVGPKVEEERKRRTEERRTEERRRPRPAPRTPRPPTEGVPRPRI
jgi:hypothetical protein